MPTPKSFPLVRGRTMRVTAIDSCCGIIYGPDSQVVTDGFVSVALTANQNDPEPITVTNANGRTCVNDPGVPEFLGYGVEITFCDVNPCLYALVTGQPAVLDASGEVAGFRMNSATVAANNFALEVWMGVPGVACSGEGGAQGYLLLPCVSGGVIGDFTVENAAITFTLTGAATKDGNAWGTGPYDVTMDTTGLIPSPLPDPLDPDDHLYVIYTEVPPPAATDGCVALTEVVAADAEAAAARKSKAAAPTSTAS